ncbi:MAG: prolyl oligopeptidase family serine peptidase [Gemmatimonadaceae bacterium]
MFRLSHVMLLIAANTTRLAGQGTPQSFQFTIDNIMRGPELFGREPQNVRWSGDGKWIYFSWLEPGSPWREAPRAFRVRAVAGAKPERITTVQIDSAAASTSPGRLSPDRKWRAVSSQGDLYLVDANSGAPKRLTETLALETDPSFSADGKAIYFIRDGNVFALTLDGGLTRQLTDIRTPGAATAAPAALGPLGQGGGRGQGAQATGARGDSAAQKTGQRGELLAQQKALLEAVRDKLWQDSVAAAERKALAHELAPITLLANERAQNVSVSPAGSALVIATTIPADNALNTIVPNYVTASGYTEEIPGRTKVGDAQGRGRLLFARLSDARLHALRIAPEDSTGPSAQAAVLGWNDAGTMALVVAATRDFKRRYIATVTADSGTVHVVDVLHDTAWVGGPCSRCGGWLDGGKRIWFVSEADGFAHLYTMAADGSDRRQLTSGTFEVVGVSLSRDGKTFYLSSSEGSPYEQHAWRMATAGGPRTKLTSRAGSHVALVSPDESLLADVYSEANRPPELFVMANKSGAEEAQLTVSPTKEWLAFNWVKPAIVQISASDGVQVPARIYRPKELGGVPNGAAVIFVHGAGYMHNVHNYWSSYSREYMFNQYLASKGFVVLDIDYRASAGYGRDWRTAIYRFMGGRDLQDQVDGVKYLKANNGIEPKRVGIYGGSYGGFMTLMALFTEPDWFGAGAALRSVTNWAHYNHGYTASILNFPDKDTLAYHRSSPIFFAQGLNAPLLMAHGMIDTNVNFQDIVELTERLIELKKKNWDLAVYPVEDHGFVRPSSWADEYTRIYDLFDRVLVKR